MESLARTLRRAAGGLLRTPGFTVPVAVTVALGIGVAVAIFTLVNAVLLRPLAYPQPVAPVRSG